MHDDSITRLSRSGGSGLSMSMLQTCPQMLNLKMSGWRRSFTPIYFLDGILFHSMAEKIIKGDGFKSIKSIEEVTEQVYSTGILYDEDRDTEIVFDHKELAYPKKINKKTGEPSTITKAEHSKKMMNHLLFQVHYQRAAGQFNDIEETELYLEVQKLVDPTTGTHDEESQMLFDEGISFCGKLDIKKKGNVIEDLKTAKQGLGKLARLYSQQLTTYGYLNTVNYGEMTDTVGIHGFSKHVTKCDYEYEEITMPHDEWVKRYVAVFDSLKEAGKEFVSCRNSGKWPKRGAMATSCKDSYGQICIYHPVCFPGDYSETAHKEAMSKLIKE